MLSWQKKNGTCHAELVSASAAVFAFYLNSATYFGVSITFLHCCLLKKC